MKLLLEIDVKITGYEAVESKRGKIAMIEFDASCECELFKGKSVSKGCDTQTIYNSGNMKLSARYMLEGVDCEGLPCRIFIENNGPSLDLCQPKIVTNSEALSFLEIADLRANVVPTQSGVCVKIYEE